MKFYVVLIFLCFFIKIHGQELKIHNLGKDLIAMIETKSCKIKIGVTKILHPINLTRIESTIDELLNTIDKKLNNNSALIRLLNHEAMKLENNLSQLKPKRNKRWDSIGKIWKILAGSPDADDLKVINLTMNNLIDENNKQVKINKKIESEIDQILKITKRISINNNKIILEDIELITLIFNTQMINKELEQILDSIAKTKIKLVENRFLSKKEILEIGLMLEEQGIKLGIPEDALEWIQPSIATSKDTLLYIINVPKLQKDSAKVIKIRPLIVDGKKIKTDLTNVIISGSSLYTTEEPNSFIQEPKFLRNLADENCIRPIIQGLPGSCNFTKAGKGSKVIRMSDNIILLNNGVAKLSNTCGPQNRTLQGNFLIKFRNCTIWLNEEKFEFSETTENENLFFGATQDLDIEKTLVEEKLDLDDIQNLHAETRKALHHVVLKQYQQDLGIWTLGGISTTTIVFIGIIIAMIMTRRRTVIGIYGSGSATTSKDGLSQQDKTCEDTLSHPPEELCATILSTLSNISINPDASSALPTSKANGIQHDTWRNVCSGFNTTP
jgi:Gypsy protein